MTFPISRYLNVRAAYFPSFAADGRSLSFITNITGTAQIWQVDLTHIEQNIPWPDQLTFAADRVMAVQQAPADGRILYTHDIGGDENAQLFLLDPETGSEVCLTTGHEDALHIPGDWSADGRTFLFAANRRHKGYFDLYRHTLDGSEAELIWQNPQYGALFKQAFSPDGRYAAFIRMNASSQNDLFEINLATRETRQLNPTDKDARFLHVAYSKDGHLTEFGAGSLILITDLDSDFLHIAQLDRRTLTWETVVNPNWDVTMMALSPNGRYLAYVINQDGNSQLEVIDFATSMARTAPLSSSVPGVIGWYDGQMAFSADSNRLAFSYTNAIQTSDITIWDLDLNRDTLTQVTRSTHGGIPTEQFVVPELIHYPTFDGRFIPAYFYRPQTPHAPHATIVIVHGGPASQFLPYFHFLAQYFVHHGYAVLGPNVRGSTGYGKQYQALDNVEKRMDSVADLAHAAHWLKEQPGLDPQRITVYGGSYGGFMVLAALTHYPDLWNAGVNIVGISNFVTFLENTSEYRRAHRESEYGRLDRDRDFLQAIAPINHLHNIQVPLMVIHGANDPRVPLSEAEQLVAALQARHIPVELLVFDDEGHGIVKLKNKLKLYPAIIDFLQKQM